MPSLSEQADGTRRVRLDQDPRRRAATQSTDRACL